MNLVYTKSSIKFMNGQFSLANIKNRVSIQVRPVNLPNLILEDRIRLNVDCEGNFVQFQIVNQQLIVAGLAQIHELKNVGARSQHNLEGLMILLLAPRKLTRLVKQAVERVHIVLLRQHTTVGSS